MFTSMDQPFFSAIACEILVKKKKLRIGVQLLVSYLDALIREQGKEHIFKDTLTLTLK